MFSVNLCYLTNAGKWLILTKVMYLIVVSCPRAVASDGDAAARTAAAKLVIGLPEIALARSPQLARM